MRGLDIAYLNGVSGSNDRSNAIRAYATHGYNDQIENELQLIAEGHDFRGVDFGNPLEVEEATHAQLERLYGVVCKCPQLISGYQNPVQFKRMLGYVLNNWDSANRENAIEQMAKEESRLIGMGAIQNNWDYADNDTFHLGDDEVYDEEEHEDAPLQAVKMRKEKRGLFNQLTKLNAPGLTAAQRRVVASNPLLAKMKDKIRQNVAKHRKLRARGVRLNSGKEVRMLQHKAEVNSVQGLCGVEEYGDLQSVLMGEDLQLANETENPQVIDNAFRNYLLRTHKVVSANPQAYFDNQDAALSALNALGEVVKQSNTIDNFQASIDRMLEDSGLKGLGSLGSQLGDFLGKMSKAEREAKRQAKKEARAQRREERKQKREEKREARWTKQAQRKGKDVQQYIAQKKEKREKVRNFFKKVVKWIIKINPICLIMRGGLLLAMRLNMFKFAAKLYPGSVTEADALKLGFTKEQYDKMKQGYEKALSFYTKIGGKKETFDKVLIKGAKRTWGGSEVYSKEELKKAVSNNINALKEDITAQEAKMKKDGVQFVSDPKLTYSEEKVEQTVEATNGLGAALCAIYELEHSDMRGLGALGEAITVATVTTTAGSTLAAIGAFLGKLGIKSDWIKKVAEKAKNVVDKVKNSKFVQAIKSAKEKYNEAKQAGAEAYNQSQQSGGGTSKVRSFIQSMSQTATGNANNPTTVNRLVQSMPSQQQQTARDLAKAASKNMHVGADGKIKRGIATSESYQAVKQEREQRGEKPTLIRAQESRTTELNQSSSSSKKMFAAGGILLLAGLGTYLYNKKNS